MSLNVLSDFAVQFAFPLIVPKEFSPSSRTFEPATSSSSHLAVEKMAPFPVLFFFSTICFQEHLKVLKSPAPVFCQFPSKLRLLQLFHFSHLCTLFLTLCKKDMTQEFWQESSGLFLLRSFPGHSHMQLATILKDSPLLWACIGCSKHCASWCFCPSLLLNSTGFQATGRSGWSLAVVTAPTWLPLLLLPRIEQGKQMVNTFFCNSCSSPQLCLINCWGNWDG